MLVCIVLETTDQPHRRDFHLFVIEKDIHQASRSAEKFKDLQASEDVGLCASGYHLPADGDNASFGVFSECLLEGVEKVEQWGPVIHKIYAFLGGFG